MTVFAIYGAGEMGSQIGDGLVARGESLLVHDPFTQRPWPGSDLSKESVVRAADVHLVCVRGVKTASEVLLGEDGVVRFAKPTSLALLMTTMTPFESRQLAQQVRDRDFGRIADAAMSRRGGLIADRSLTVLLGAEPDVSDDATRSCAVFADNVIHVGGVGAGMAAKLVNNWLLQANRASLIQAVRTAQVFGIAQDSFVEVINGSSGASWVSAQWGDAECALLCRQPVERALAERTEEEVAMLVESMDAANKRFDLGLVTGLIDDMKGVPNERV